MKKNHIIIIIVIIVLLVTSWFVPIVPKYEKSHYASICNYWEFTVLKDIFIPINNHSNIFWVDKNCPLIYE
jgi:hypothetical protein